MTDAESSLAGFNFAEFTRAEFTLGEHRIPDLRTRRMGVIVPASNTNAEPDCLMLAASGLTLHVTRSGGYDVEAIPDST